MTARMTVLLILFLLIVSPSWLFATSQFPDVLEYKGHEYRLFSNPLEDYFEQQGYRPRLPMNNTGCWRGYIAYFEIKDDGFLYLVKIVRQSFRDSEEYPEMVEIVEIDIPISYIFPGRQAPIKADWYSGTLRVPRGHELLNVNMGYLTIYEYEMRFTIRDGEFIELQVINNIEKMKELKKSPEYMRRRQALLDEGYSSDWVDNDLPERMLYEDVFADPKKRDEVFKGLPNEIER